MFNSIRGKITAKRADGVLVETGGIEWDIAAPSLSIVDFGDVGSETRVYTWLLHREDGMRLFGFPTEVERKAFLELQKVEGIGPKQALKILSSLRPEALAVALETEDLAALERAPGVGKKTAQKILLSLKGKLVLVEDKNEAGAGAWADVARALADMGFERKAADRAVAALAPEMAAVDPGLREHELFKRALLALSSRA